MSLRNFSARLGKRHILHRSPIYNPPLRFKPRNCKLRWEQARAGDQALDHRRLLRENPESPQSNTSSMTRKTRHLGPDALNPPNIGTVTTRTFWTSLHWEDPSRTVNSTRVPVPQRRVCCSRRSGLQQATPGGPALSRCCLCMKTAGKPCHEDPVTSLLCRCTRTASKAKMMTLLRR